MSSSKGFVCSVLMMFASAAAPKVADAELPSPTLLVVLKNEGALAALDPVTKKVIGKVPISEVPHEVTATPDGKLAFVGSFGGGDRAFNPARHISVVDLGAMKVVRQIDALSPHGVAFVDGRLYFTAQGWKLIGRYDPTADRIDWLMGTGQDGTHRLVLTRDATKIFAANSGSDTVSVFERFDIPPNWVHTLIRVGKGPEALHISPDEREVWVAHNADCCVSVIDVATKKVVHTLDVKGKRLSALRFTPDGRLVLIGDMETNVLTIVDVAQRKIVKTIGVGRLPENVFVPPDGLRAYVAITGEGHLAVLDLKTLEIVDHIPVGNGPDGMTWISK